MQASSGKAGASAWVVALEGGVSRREEEAARGAGASAMAQRPKRTFLPRRADSSDSDGAQETFAEPGATGEQWRPGTLRWKGPPCGRGHAEVSELRRRGRKPPPRPGLGQFPARRERLRAWTGPTSQVTLRVGGRSGEWVR